MRHALGTVSAITALTHVDALTGIKVQTVRREFAQVELAGSITFRETGTRIKPRGSAQGKARATGFRGTVSATLASQAKPAIKSSARIIATALESASLYTSLLSTRS